MADPETDALVAARFPLQWARAKSKQRNKLRRRFNMEVKLSDLRKAGACCADCEHFGTMPTVEGNICEVTTDFYGYTRAEPTGLCTDFSPVRPLNDTEKSG